MAVAQKFSFSEAWASMKAHPLELWVCNHKVYRYGPREYGGCFQMRDLDITTGKMIDFWVPAIFDSDLTHSKNWTHFTE